MKQPYKNSGHVLLCGIILRREGRTEVVSDKVAEVARRHGLDKRWNSSSDPMDEHGLKRAIGDVMGGHGKLFKLLNNNYPARFELPDIIDFEDTEAIRAWSTGRGIDADGLMAQFNEARRVSGV